MKRCKTACSIVTTSDGISTGVASGNFDMSDSGVGASYEVVKQAEEDQLATSGVVGAAFIEISVPSTIEQIAIKPLAQQEIAIRLNGEPAEVLSSSSTGYSTIADTDAFTLALDQAAAASIVFATGDTTLAKIVKRINAAVGAIVASDDGAGKLLLTGEKTGGELAKNNTMQYGSIVLVDGSGSPLAKLGLVAGTTYGSALADLRTTSRFLLEPPTSGAGAVTKIELSGSGKVMWHVAGRA